MTTTDLEPYVEAEIVETHELSAKEAKALDKKIRTASDRVSTESDKLLNLLEEAAAGNIHKALGLPSWTAWFKDAVQISVNDRFERQELAKMMSGKGMSQRAIAGALGVSQKTVDRDLDGEEVEEGATVVSLDGAERPKNKPKAEESQEDSGQEPLDVEAEEAPDDPMTAADIVKAFGDEVANLFAAQQELTFYLTEEKWGGARKRCATADLNNLQQIITDLQLVVDDLVTGQ